MSQDQDRKFVICSRNRTGKSVCLRLSDTVLRPSQSRMQAYLSLTRGDGLALSKVWASSRDQRIACAQRGPRPVKVAQKRKQPRTRPTEYPVKTRNGLENGRERSARDEQLGNVEDSPEFSGGEDAISTAENDNLPSKGIWHVHKLERTGQAGDGGSAYELRIPDRRKSKSDDALQAPTGGREKTRASSRGEHGRGSSSKSSWWCSMEVCAAHDVFNYYPSRPVEAEAPVSLISPRTSKKIRRLPPPGQDEQAILHVNNFRRNPNLLTVLVLVCRVGWNNVNRFGLRFD